MTQRGTKGTVLFVPLLITIQGAQNFWGIGIRNHGRPWACEEATEKVPRIA